VRPADRRTDGVSKRMLSLAVCCVGVSALMTQLTLMRELLSVFSGNELVFGIVLGNWLLLSGIGAILGKAFVGRAMPAADSCASADSAHPTRRAKPIVSLFIVAQILVALLPLANVLLLRTLRNQVFLRGAEVGVTETVVSCFVLLAPYCLATGCLLTWASLLLARSQPESLSRAEENGSRTGFLTRSARLGSPDWQGNSIGSVYFFDNLGSVVGGLLFCFVLIHLLGHFGVLCFPAMLNLFCAAVLAVLAGKRLLTIAAAVSAVALVAAMALGDFDTWSIEKVHAGQRVVYHGHSPYGSLVVTEAAGQYNFIESGVVLFSTHNVEEVEEAVHYAMAQRPKAERVLLISGGVSGTAREILKYGCSAVDYLEIDPLILRVAAQYLPNALADPRIHVIPSDGRQFVKQTPRRYGVVIVDVASPSTSQLNRFYTREFFAEVKRVLEPGGVLCFPLATYEDYLSPELADLIAVAHRTAGSEFHNVLLLPGGRVYVLASDGPLTAHIAERIEQAGVETRLVNRHYLQATLSADRMAEVARAPRTDAAINEDFSPILYYYHLRYWMSHFRFRFGLLEGALLAALAIYLVRIRPVPLVVFSGGFAASALEVVLLMGLQVLNGCLYHQVGLIITTFMLGLGIGSLVMNRLAPRRPPIDLVKLALAIAVFAVFLPLVLTALGRLESAAAPLVSQVVVPLVTFLLAVLVGLEFPLAGKIDYQGAAATAARLYAADFIGAALGALLVSTWLIPVLGVTAVCLLSAAINVFAAAVLFAKIRRGNV
jgi:spermidine synthase